MATKAKSKAKPKLQPNGKMTRTDAVASTWQNPKVRAARRQRTRVRVKGEEYRSTKAAFAALNLPENECNKFRLKLKAAATGRAVHAGYTFSVVKAK